MDCSDIFTIFVNTIIILAVLIPHGAMVKRQERRRIAKELFRRSEFLLQSNRFQEACGTLSSISATDIFFSDTNTFSWEAFFRKSGIKKEIWEDLRERINIELRNERAFYKPMLSEEELAQAVERIWSITAPPEGFDTKQAVTDAVNTFWMEREKEWKKNRAEKK